MVQSLLHSYYAIEHKAIILLFLTLLYYYFFYFIYFFIYFKQINLFCKFMQSKITINLNFTQSITPRFFEFLDFLILKDQIL